MLKLILIALGSISLALGVIGIVVPGLPTTPFLLLSSFCYIRSSKRLYNWLHSHPLLGSYLKQFTLYHALTLKTKVTAITSMWFVMSISIIFFIPVLPGKIGIAACGIAVTTYLLRFRTLTPELKAEIDKRQEESNLAAQQTRERESK